MKENDLSNNSLRCVAATPEYIGEAAVALKAGRLVAFPTETVYGLGALATHAGAVSSIYETKGRPSNNPLIVHVLDLEMASRYADIDTRAERLANQFFPGALTLVLPLKAGALVPEIHPNNSTVALRCPVHPVARALIAAAGGGIAAPSANKSGKISPTTAQHVLDEFAQAPGNCAMVLDGGSTTLGLESTVVGFADDYLAVFRPGTITCDELKRAAGEPIRLEYAGKNSTLLSSPGLLTSHYAPNTPVMLEQTRCVSDDVFIGFGAIECHQGIACLNLSVSGNLDEAASRLYGLLRQADALKAASICVAPIPAHGVGVAINDRLRRAAAR